VREENKSTALDFTPTINVNGAFTGGGNNGGNNDDVLGPVRSPKLHFDDFRKALRKIRRLAWRAAKDVNVATSGFNGAYTFGAAKR